MAEETEMAFYYKESILPRELQKEFALLGAIVIQFEQMDEAARSRILAYLNESYGG